MILILGLNLAHPSVALLIHSMTASTTVNPARSIGLSPASAHVQYPPPLRLGFTITDLLAPFEAVGGIALSESYREDASAMSLFIGGL